MLSDKVARETLVHLDKCIGWATIKYRTFEILFNIDTVEITARGLLFIIK
jgi:hypothetical protein